MEILKSYKYEETEVMLKLGEDFKKYNLYNFCDTGNMSIDSGILTLIAKEKRI